jgi:hypothetical protein
MYLKRDFGLYPKIPGHHPRRRWVDLDSKDKPVKSPSGLGAKRNSPSLIVICI